MPVDAAQARNHFLAAVATVIDRGAAKDPATLEVAAAQAATDLAAQHPGIAADELLAQLPEAWKQDPGSYSVKDQANAFLKVAGPVLGVAQGVVSPIATRGVLAAEQMQVVLAVNKARQAAATPSAALDAVVDPRTASFADVAQALEKAVVDPVFRARFGAHQASTLRDVPRELAAALSYAQPPTGPEVQVFAGGVPVPGRAQHDARPHGLFRSVPAPTTIGALAMAAAHMAVLRASLDEAALRGALSATDRVAVSGRGPPADAMPLHVVLSDDGKSVGVGLGLDVAALRRWHDDPTADDVAYVQRAGQHLRAQDAALAELLGRGAPPALFLDGKSRAVIASV